MRFPFLLAMLIAASSASAQGLPQPLVPAFDEAVRLADENRDDEALVAFQQRAAANPNDHAARLWIARLHERMGHSDLAEPVYRSVLLEDPSSIDARLAVASLVLERNGAEEAIEILEAAERSGSDSAAALALLGRAHRVAGHDALALQYFERAVAAEPSDRYRHQLETAQHSYLHRVEARGFTEQFSETTPDSRSGEIVLNYRLNDRVRVLGRGEVQRKFGVSDKRGGGGAEWRWTPAATLRGQILIGPDNRVMPEGDYLGELHYTRGPATWSAGVRHFDFTGARTTVFSPSVAWLASDRLLAHVRYAMSWTEISDLSGDIGQSLHLAADYRLHYRLWLRGGYAAGVENFDNFSIDRVGDFRANALSGGVRIPLRTLTTIVGNYEHQWRRDDVSMGRATISLLQSF
jgi:YaiO family outer membrane protein